MSKNLFKLFSYTKTLLDYDDFALIFSDLKKEYLKVKIHHLCKQGILERLTKGVYYIKEKGYDAFEIPTKLYAPSYISFHSALYHHAMIFQLPEGISFAYKRNIEKPIGSHLIYSKRLKESILYNVEGIVSNGVYSIASKERAFLDTLYIYGDCYFDNLEGLNKKKTLEMVKIYQNASFEKKVPLYLKNIEICPHK